MPFFVKIAIWVAEALRISCDLKLVFGGNKDLFCEEIFLQPHQPSCLCQ